MPNGHLGKEVQALQQDHGIVSDLHLMFPLIFKGKCQVLIKGHAHLRDRRYVEGVFNDFKFTFDVVTDYGDI